MELPHLTMSLCSTSLRLFKGYQKAQKLDKTEIKSIYYIFISIQFIFLAFSININNYKAARFNWDIINWAIENRQKIDAVFLNSPVK